MNFIVTYFAHPRALDCIPEIVNIVMYRLMRESIRMHYYRYSSWRVQSYTSAEKLWVLNIFSIKSMVDFEFIHNKSKAVKWFCLCAEFGFLGSMQYLSKNFSITKSDFNPISALDYAVNNGRVDIIKYLLEELRVSPRPLKSNENRALRTASTFGYTDLVEYIVNNIGLVYIHRPRLDIDESIRSASENGHLNIVICIANAFPKINIRSNNNYAIRHSSANGYLDIVEYLVETFHLSKEDILTLNGEALRLAAKNNHLDIVTYFVETFKLTERDPGYFAAIDISMRNNYDSIVDYLVERLK